MDKDMNILITGSNGLLGSACVEFFKDKGWNVVGIDNNMRSYFFGVELPDPDVPMDIRDEKDINKLFEQNHFSAVIHCAAQPSHDWSKKEPLTDFDVNARGTLILLEATRKYCPEAVFVHVSTDKVYGTNMEREDLWENETRYYHNIPFDETTSINDGEHSLFGCSKVAADLYAQEYWHVFGIKTGVFRPGCITGKAHKGAEEHGFLAYLAKCVKEKKPYKIFGFKGKQVRDQIHALDLASAFYEFIFSPTPGAVYNIGGGEERSVSVLEAINLLERKTGNKLEFTFGEARKGDRIWDVHDVSKFHKDYPDWKYEYSLNDIIEELCS